MLSVQATGLGKQFNRHWLFRGVDFTVAEGQALAVTGANGSGKSTLLQLLAGLLPPTEGTIDYHLDGAPLPRERWYELQGIAAPYQDLVDDFTLLELLHFHQQFKPFANGWKPADVVAALRLKGHEHKQVGVFSSGMKQRLKLGLALFCQNRLLLLDEPTANMDVTNATWYAEMLPTLLPGRVVIVFSNDPAEYTFCQQVIHLAAPGS